MKNKPKIKELLKKGLYQDNLEDLLRLCEKNLHEDPALYFTLHNIFEEIASEYEGQGITTSRYNQFNALSPLIVSAIDAPSIETLNALIKAYIAI